MFRNGDYIAHCRGKDGEIQSLVDHLEAVSKKTGEFASKIGLKEQGELLGLLHDIGKASQEFKQYIKSSVGLINPDEDEYVDADGGGCPSDMPGGDVVRFCSKRGHLLWPDSKAS